MSNKDLSKSISFGQVCGWLIGSQRTHVLSKVNKVNIYKKKKKKCRQYIGVK